MRWNQELQMALNSLLLEQNVIGRMLHDGARRRLLARLTERSAHATIKEEKTTTE